MKGYRVPWPFCSDCTNSAVFPALFYLVLLLELLDNFNCTRLKFDIHNGLKSILIRTSFKVPWTTPEKGCWHWEGMKGEAFQCISSPNLLWYHPCYPYQYPSNSNEHKETKWGLVLTWWNPCSQRQLISGNKALAVYLQLCHGKGLFSQ